jgi:hypothetical protein
MKHTFLTLSLILLSLTAIARGEKFQEAMVKTLAGYETCQSAADFNELSAKFVRIAQAEPEEWLPLYYQAHAIIVGNFRSTETAVDRDLMLDEAQKALDKLIAMDPTNSEVMVLQGMLYTGRLVIDPQTRGQEYGAKSAIAVGKAQGINPNNPRARYMQIANEQGTARFFGKDMQEYCDKAAALLADWDSLNVIASPIHPSWGKEMTAGIAKSCD